MPASLYGPREDGRGDLCRAPDCDNPRAKTRATCNRCYFKRYDVGHRNRRSVDRDSEGRKWCFGCEEWQEVAVFGQDAQRSDGLRVRCRKCESITYRARTYGLSQGLLFGLLQQQGMKCAICLEGLGERWCVDHDHSCCPGTQACGKCVRGALCLTCNSGLGMFRDSVEVLERARLYLQR